MASTRSTHTTLTGRTCATLGMSVLGLTTTEGGVIDVRPYQRSFGRRRQRSRT